MLYPKTIEDDDTAVLESTSSENEEDVCKLSFFKVEHKICIFESWICIWKSYTRFVFALIFVLDILKTTKICTLHLLPSFLVLKSA